MMSVTRCESVGCRLSQVLVVTLAGVAMLMMLSFVTGCATWDRAVERYSLSRQIARLGIQARDVSPMVAAVLSDDDRSELRALLQRIAERDFSRLGTEDSALWQWYLDFRRRVVNAYLARDEPVPERLRRFNRRAEAIHARLGEAQNTVKFAQRLLRVYRALKL